MRYLLVLTEHLALALGGDTNLLSTRQQQFGVDGQKNNRSMNPKHTHTPTKPIVVVTNLHSGST